MSPLHHENRTILYSDVEHPSQATETSDLLLRGFDDDADDGINWIMTLTTSGRGVLKCESEYSRTMI